MAAATPHRRWVKVGFAVGAVLLVLSALSWSVGPAQDEGAITVRLFLLAVSFMVLVGSLIGWIVTSGD